MISRRYGCSGTVGEPINPEAWIWYHEHIGSGRCPIVDTWWQTETGGIMISPLPGITTTKPGSATKPLPGIVADVVDDQGKPVPLGEGGYLVLKQPWPSMLRGIYGDPERYKATYWSKFPGMYFTGDGAARRGRRLLAHGSRRRCDERLRSPSLHHGDRERARRCTERSPKPPWSGSPDEITGEAICCFVILKSGIEPSDELGEELRQHVARKIGPIARPRQLMFTPDLPKTRSGKIMRRLLRDIAVGRQLGIRRP